MKDNEEFEIKTWNFDQAINKTLEEKHPHAYVVPTFKTFFTPDELHDILENAGTIGVWDFNTSLGDTIKEKYESLYVRVVELTNVLIHKGAKGYFWIVTSPMVASIFECATAGFIPAGHWSDSDRGEIGGIYPMGLHEVQYLGRVDRRWRLYADPTMAPDQILIGCNDMLEDYSHYGRLNVSNLVI